MLTFLKRHWLKFTGGTLVLVLLMVFWQRDNIANNKFAKAKMEIFKAALENDTARIKEVIDSLDI